MKKRILYLLTLMAHFMLALSLCGCDAIERNNKTVEVVQAGIEERNAEEQEKETKEEKKQQKERGSELLEQEKTSNEVSGDGESPAYNDDSERSYDALVEAHPLIGLWKSIDGTVMEIAEDRLRAYSPLTGKIVVDRSYEPPYLTGYSDYYDLYGESGTDYSFMLTDRVFYNDFGKDFDIIGLNSVLISQYNVIDPDYTAQTEPLHYGQTFIRINSMEEKVAFRNTGDYDKAGEYAAAIQGTWRTEFSDISTKVVITDSTIKYTYISNYQEVSNEDYKNYQYTTYSVEYQIESIYDDVGCDDIEIEILCSNNEHRHMTLRGDKLILIHEGVFELSQSPPKWTFQEYLDYIKQLPG